MCIHVYEWESSNDILIFLNVQFKGYKTSKTYQVGNHMQTATLVSFGSDRTNTFISITESLFPDLQRVVILVYIAYMRCSCIKFVRDFTHVI